MAEWHNSSRPNQSGYSMGFCCENSKQMENRPTKKLRRMRELATTYEFHPMENKCSMKSSWN